MIEDSTVILAKIGYNPYTRRLDVEFNNEKPMVNSLINEYYGKPLREWVDKVPEIFKDEMNGYGFILEFNGTLLDYKYLQSSFRVKNALVEDDIESTNKVALTHKKVLEDCEKKEKRVEELLEWLKNNRNSNFDYDVFGDNHSEIIDTSFTCILLNTKTEDVSSINLSKVSVECIDDISKLDNTNLNGSPILVYLNNESLDNRSEYYIKKIVDRLINRKQKDVNQNQLFYCIEKEMDSSYVTRIIKDLRLNTNMIVSGPEDEKIVDYIWLYPKADYIHGVLITVRNELERIRDINGEHRIEWEKSGKENYKQIETIDLEITRLKELEDEFQRRDRLDVPYGFKLLSDRLFMKIMQWRSNRTKIIAENDAKMATSIFVVDSIKYYKTFYSDLLQQLKKEEDKVRYKYAEWYKSSGIDESFDLDESCILDVSEIPFPVSIEDLMQIKVKETFIEQDNIIDAIFNPTPTAEKKIKEETVYYYQAWREYVSKMLKPVVKRLIETAYEKLQNYSNRLANEYMNRISVLLLDLEKNKKTASMRLSADERKLQDDTDWINKLDEKLNDIGEK